MARRPADPGGSYTSAWTPGTGEIVAAALTTNDEDDASQVGPLLEQLEGSVASLTGDGAYDQDIVYRSVIDRDPEALVIVPPRATAVLCETAEIGWRHRAGLPPYRQAWLPRIPVEWVSAHSSLTPAA
jgi:hypothetical protein